MNPPTWAYLSLAASMALVGSYVGLSKLLVAVFPVLLLAWLRFGIAAIAMAHWVRQRPGDLPLSPHDRKLLFLESFLGNFLFSICMLYGVLLTSAVAAGVTMAAIPAAVALLSRLFLGEYIRGRVLLAIACAAAGIALLALARGDSAAGETASPLGYALLLAAVLCEASYVVIGKRLTGQVSPRRISALINLWGLALVTPFGLWQAWSFDFGGVPGSLWLLLGFFGLGANFFLTAFATGISMLIVARLMGGAMQANAAVANARGHAPGHRRAGGLLGTRRRALGQSRSDIRRRGGGVDRVGTRIQSGRQAARKNRRRPGFARLGKNRWCICLEVARGRLRHQRCDARCRLWRARRHRFGRGRRSLRRIGAFGQSRRFHSRRRGLQCRNLRCLGRGIPFAHQCGDRGRGCLNANSVVAGVTRPAAARAVAAC